MKIFRNQNKKGIALFIAIIIVSAITLITFAIADIAFKEQILTYSGKDSKIAFYAADAGLECALYHDVKKEGFYFAKNHLTSQSGSIVCNEAGLAGDPILPIFDLEVQSATTTFSFNIDWSGSQNNGKSCAIVKVSKTLIGAGPDIHTRIESRGYNNTCTGISVDVGARNLERALEVSY